MIKILKILRCRNKFGMTDKVTVYKREYELLKKAAFGDLKERQAATKALRNFTTEALRKETLKRVQGDDWRVA